MDTNRLAKELREIQSDTKSGVTVTVLGDNLAHMQGTLMGARPDSPPDPAPRPEPPRPPRSDLPNGTRPRRPSLTVRPPRPNSTTGPEESPYQGGKFYVRLRPRLPGLRPSPSPPLPLRPIHTSQHRLADVALDHHPPLGCLAPQVDIQLTNAYPFEPPKMRFITKVWHPNVSSANGAICLDILKEQWSPALSIKTAMLSLQALLSSPEPNDPQDAVVARQYIDEQHKFVEQARAWTAQYATENARDEKLEKLKEMGFEEAAARTALARAAGDENQALELLLTGL